jgi:hypothetical protein
MKGDETYNRGFFFGPGLPLGLGCPSIKSAIFRLVPGAGPFRFFVGSDEVGLSDGSGVEFDSDAASVLASVTLTIGGSFVIGVGDGGSGWSDGVDSGSCGVCFSSNLDRSSDGRRSIIVLEGIFIGHEVKFEVGVGDDDEE